MSADRSRSAARSSFTAQRSTAATAQPRPARTVKATAADLSSGAAAGVRRSAAQAMASPQRTTATAVKDIDAIKAIKIGRNCATAAPPGKELRSFTDFLHVSTGIVKLLAVNSRTQDPHVRFHRTQDASGRIRHSAPAPAAGLRRAPAAQRNSGSAHVQPAESPHASLPLRRHPRSPPALPSRHRVLPLRVPPVPPPPALDTPTAPAPAAPRPRQQAGATMTQQPVYPPPGPPRPDRRRTYTYQRGSTAFHVTMTILTCGAWLLVWPFFRRKVRVRTRYR